MNRWMLPALLVAATLVAIILFRRAMDKARKMIAPVSARVSSAFGNRTHPVTGESGSFHNGIDYAIPVGTDVRSPFDGEVTQRYVNSAGGLQLIIRHSNGYTSGFAHLSSAMVDVGDQVGKGQVIALSGDTGRVTGPHLHYTLRGPEGDFVNPELYLA